MADFDFPADLLDLQRAWYVADARCVEVAASMPSARDVAAVVAAPTAEQQTALAEARAERLRVTEALHDHEWWDTVEKNHRLAARAALRKLAQQ